MRPPVPTMFPKVVPPQGDEIDGKFIPGGTSIGWNLMPMMRSPRYWGHDPDIFRPERFMEADDKARLSMERNVDLAFGYGRYGCAGKPLGYSTPWISLLCAAKANRTGKRPGASGR